MSKVKKKYIVQRKTNPRDDWKDLKIFTNKKRAIQSFEMLNKHVTNILKNSGYMKYRIYDKTNNALLKTT